MKAAEPSMRSASRRLAAWYGRHARDLPWRGRPTAYHVLVSEVMLQQTTVETVVSYYLRFIERFPDLRALAAAREEDLLRLWSGLGYYRRARGLLAAAKEILARHGGAVPASREDLLALPGIGPYTASAILALAHGRSEVALDGNLRRVLSRLAGHESDAFGTRGSRALEAVGRRLLEGSDPAVINQALMDLGASLCSPRAPGCPRCPLSRECVARARGRQESIPVARRRDEGVAVRMAAAVARRDGRLLLRQRSGNLMHGLWEFPMVEVDRGERVRPAGPNADREVSRRSATARRLLASRASRISEAARARGERRARLSAEEALVRDLARCGVRTSGMSRIGTVRHAITKHRISVEIFDATFEVGRGVQRRDRRAAPRKSRARTGPRHGPDLAGADGAEVRWVPLSGIERMALGGIACKILRLLRSRTPERTHASGGGRARD